MKCERCGKETVEPHLVPIRRDGHLITYAMVCRRCWLDILALAERAREQGTDDLVSIELQEIADKFGLS